MTEIIQIPLASRILSHIKLNREESKRCMAGFIAAFGKEAEPDRIRFLVDELADDGWIVCYGNGKRHCWKSVFPTVVCFCGSIRFRDVFLDRQAFEENVNGNIVLMPVLFWAGHPFETSLERLRLLHMNKIDLSDEILVINEGGHIGDDTKAEIEYATARGKSIRYLVTPS